MVALTRAEQEKDMKIAALEERIERLSRAVRISNKTVRQLQSDILNARVQLRKTLEVLGER
jgi:predicted RNase H-like nuclease (RuvC/YqgF family)